MFNDWQQALEAEGLPLNPNPVEQQAAAARTVARRASSKEDLVLLLDAVGLPGDDDTLAPLLPLLTSPDDAPHGESMTISAFTATAASMLTNGDSPEHVRSTLGLSDSELAEAVQHARLPRLDTAPAPATDDSSGTGHTQSPASGRTADTDRTEELLEWAQNQPAAGIRNRAARVRGDLIELTVRRAVAIAQQEAEEQVARARAELDAAQERLRRVKVGDRITTSVKDTTPPGGDPAPAAGRSKEELAAIRTWARANGYQVADRGTPAKKVLDAYNAAHGTTDRAEAGR
ncbi:Lsr2 dimerization domain-containing protein [Streptomyces sp. PsTaAH-124]|uniref:Lsr2 family DNA-binding protein n=1 Tax=Streptomyces sp. PsTaAH-124 TaxID=1157638 RepID=UPI0003735F0F|nr:histone-like nucleoid-structuring protein Lsr2 [Streptomyces sp. PsTaAH-124]